MVWYLAACTCHATGYNDHLFGPYQLIRNKLFKLVPISIGDVIYIAWGIGITLAIVKWVGYLFRLRTHGHKLLYGLLKACTTIAALYLLFMIGWGGNYYKEPLQTYWQLDTTKWNNTSVVQYDRYLVQELNALAPHYYNPGFASAEEKGKEYYARYTDCYHHAKGLHVKPTLFGNLMEYIHVQGYYNPFTGEGQVNDGQPGFMIPFVVAHEMAHQAGVGAEDDANLVAYAVSVTSQDTAFLYSAYFNLWLYTHFQLRMRDTAAASAIRKDLNPLSLAQLDTLRQLRRKYRSKLGNYTGEMYDQYLKANNQKEGIASYDKVTVSGWLWELRRHQGLVNKMYIP